MEIKQLESNLNDFIVSIGVYNNIVFNQLPFYYNLCIELSETLQKHFNYYEDKIDYSKISKISLFDKLDLIKDFYKNVGISFDIDKYISDGTINFENYDHFYDNEDTESKKTFMFGYGLSSYEGEKKLVDVCNNGLITDIPVIVHELSHFRDQPDVKRNQVSDLLTETLAITEEFICCDYLSQKGYKSEMNFFLERQLYSLYKSVEYMKSIYRMLLLYDEIGSISKDNYLYYYENDECYDSDIKRLEYFNLQRFVPISWYVLSTALAPYLYCKYKEDSSFMKNIISLHDSINNKDIITCFKEMGLTNFNSNERKQMLECIDKIMSNINSVKTL